MNIDWKQFLEENGAEFALVADSVNDVELEQLISFDGLDHKLSSQDNLLSVPSNRGLLKVTGEDAETFLQNQLTNDIRKVNETNHQASAWCSPKGRIIVNFRIFKRDNAFYLSLSSDLIEHVIKKLRMYVMMSKVVIEDVSDSIVHFTFASKNADVLLQQAIGLAFDSISDSDSTETSSSQTYQHKSLSLLRYADEITRFDFFGGLDDAKDVWARIQKLETPIKLVSDKGQTFLNISAGRPEISAASSEAWIPQMVNYIHVDGVDFKKGCYPGQEVVARLNYLGKTKRRMFLLEIDTNELPEIGAKIKSEKDAEAGKILNAVVNADNKVEALAVLKIADAKSPLSYGENDATIAVLDLPYDINDE